MTSPTEERCICCDLPLIGCGKAAEQRQRAEEKPSHGAETTAKFPGLCRYCHNHIEPGEQITYDEEYGWVCKPCEQELAS